MSNLSEIFKPQRRSNFWQLSDSGLGMDRPMLEAVWTLVDHSMMANPRRVTVDWSKAI